MYLLCTHGLLVAAPGEGPLLADYKEHHTDVSVHFAIDVVPGKLGQLQAAAGGLEAKFKLNSKISTGEGCAVCPPLTAAAIDSSGTALHLAV